MKELVTYTQKKDINRSQQKAVDTMMALYHRAQHRTIYNRVMSELVATHETSEWRMAMKNQLDQIQKSIFIGHHRVKYQDVLKEIEMYRDYKTEHSSKFKRVLSELRTVWFVYMLDNAWRNTYRNKLNVAINDMVEQIN